MKANALKTIDPKELTPKQRRAWDETRSAMLFEAPMFSHILYSMMEGKHGDQAVFSHDVPTAATDDKRLIVNPDTFLTREIGHRVFMAAHVVCHAMLGHAKQAEMLRRAGEVRYNDGTVIAFDADSLGKAQDYFVNAMLRDSKVGTVPADAIFDPRFDANTSVLDIYRVVYEENPKDDQGGGGSSDGQGDGQGQPPPPNTGNFDSHLPPGAGGGGETPQQAMDDRDDDQWEAEVQAAADAAKAQGKLPAAMESALTKAMAPERNWKDELRAMLDKAVGIGSYDWRTPDRRMISRPLDPVFAPGRRGFKCKLLVVVGDSSGSINDPTESAFMGQLGNMIDDLEPQRILFTWCDARTHGWSELESLEERDALAKKGAKGRGGTNFKPPFREIEEMGETPDAMIYLTDGDGPFPSEPPPYQVIWGDISGEPKKYPFGDVVAIPVQKEV